ncbi:hypothetical protein [Haliangium ochraceum]|nr:hypothetical protein [Haliangium ochraceum]
MRTRLLGILVSVLSLLVAGCGSSQEKRRMRHLAPTQFGGAESSRFPEVKYIARLRVYATPAHQAQSSRWQQRFADELDYVNQYLIPNYGLRFEIEGFADWPRTGNDDSLPQMLSELRQLDTAEEVDWVVGLGSALNTTSNSFHQIGLASHFDRHMVLRGFEDVAADEALRELDEHHRLRLRGARRQHRQAAIFLHEWAHTMGALHVDDRDAFMAPSYRLKTNSFSPETNALLLAVLPARMEAVNANESLRAHLAAMRQHLEHNSPQAWDPDELEALRETMADLQSFFDRQDEEKVAAGEVARVDEHGVGQVPEEVRELYEQIQALHRSGAHEQARSMLDNLIASYPAHLEFRLSACALALNAPSADADADADATGATGAGTGTGAAAAPPPDPDALATCARLGLIAPASAAAARADLLAAGALRRAEQGAEAATLLAQARERIAANADEPSAAEAWTQLVAGLQALGAVTWVEQAIASAPAGVDTAEVQTWATQQRRRYGLPPNAARHRIAPADEGAYLRAVREALAVLYRGDRDGAWRAATSALQRYRNAPGLRAVQCDIELRRQRRGHARAHCQAALAAYSETSWARYLLGILELYARKNRAGIAQLERAIELDPSLQQAYRALHQAYGRTSQRAAQEQLEARYLERFGQVLAP